jgi:hypothetical protein
MRGRPAAELLSLPVRLRGIQLGRPTDVVVDIAAGRAHGLDVLCGDGAHRFLPFAAVTIADHELTVTSALTLLEEAELSFYRARARTLADLRGRAFVRDGSPVGRLVDVEVASGGAIASVLVDDGGGVRRIEPDDGLALAAA